MFLPISPRPPNGMKESCPNVSSLKFLGYKIKKPSSSSEEGFHGSLRFSLPTIAVIPVVTVFAPAAAVVPAGPVPAEIAFAAAEAATVPAVAAAEAAFTASSAEAALAVAAAAKAAFTASPAAPAVSLVPATAALAVFHRPGFIDHDRPGTHRTAVELLDCGLGFQVRRHFHETKTLGTARHLVHDDFGAFYPSASGKKLLEFRVRRLKRQATDIESLAHCFPQKRQNCVLWKGRLMLGGVGFVQEGLAETVH